MGHATPRLPGTTSAADEQRLRALLEHSSEAIALIDTESRILYASPSTERVLGLRAEEFVGVDGMTLVHPEDQPAAQQKMAAIAANPGRTESIEVRVRHKDGSWRWIESIGTNLLADPLVQGIVVNYRDISERKRIQHELEAGVRERTAHLAAANAALQEEIEVRKRAEEALRRSEESFRLLVAGVKDYAIFLLDPQGYIVTWNAGAERIKGYRADEIIGQHFSRFYLPDDVASGRPGRALERALAHGAYEEEGLRLRKGGSSFWADVVMTALYDASGRHVGFAEVTRDITERKQVEQALRTSEARLRLILETAHEAFVTIDETGAVTAWNPQAERTFGWTRDEAIGRLVHELIIPPRDHAAHLRGLERFLAKGEGPVLNKRLQLLARHRSGHEIHVELTISPLLTAGKYSFNAFIHDISDRVRAEEKLKRFAAELARSNRELQEFAAVASHDMQEPLRKIRTFGDRLVSRAAAVLDPQARDYLERMQSSAARLQALIDGLLALTRVTTKAQPFIPTDLGELAKEVVSDLEEQIVQTGGRVAVGALPTVEADPVQMRQLLQNLIGNGLKFHRPGVPPVVRLEGAAAPNGEGGTCQVSVSDNGIGFADEYKERIFELFQRLHSRSEYEGTGLGLAICRKIVERHGGRISADGSPGQGATFTVTLPFKQRKESGTS